MGTPYPSDFARHATDALQCYADMQASVRDWTPDQMGLWQISPVPSEEVLKFYQTFFTAPSVEMDAQTLDRRIYFWPAETAAKVTEAARSYPLPDELTIPEYQHLFCVFQRPTLVLDWWNLDGVPIPIGPISAVSFCAWHGKALIVPWWWSGGRCATLNLAMASPRECLDDPVQGREKIRLQPLLAWLSVAQHFAEERLIGSSVGAVGSRTRGRVLGHVPDVQIVTLRRIDAADREHMPPLAHIDFDYRFWVGRHKRNQFYPSTGEHHTIDVGPYLKGPADKPVKERETIYAVTR